jgi:hypothetical protein
MSLVSTELPREAAPPRPDATPFNRAFLVITTTLYAVLYVQMYVIMAGYWSYLGFTLDGFDKGYHYFGYAIIAFASMFIRIDRKNVSEYIVNVLFYAIYIPSILTPLCQGRVKFDVLLWSASLLGASFIFVTWFVHLGLERVKIRKPAQIINSELFWVGLVTVWAAANIYVVLSYGSRLRFASLDDVYAQRDLADQTGSRLLNYVICNTFGGLNPFILSLGLRRRSAALVGMSVMSQGIMYSTLALKSVLAATALQIAVYYLISDRDGPKQHLLAPGLILVTVVGLMLTPFYYATGGLLDSAMSITFMRTLDMPGVLYGIYLDFFSIYPTTAYSHINVVGQFVKYPYGTLQIGQIVGNFSNPGTGYAYNTNANYLATDGITAFGLFGLPIITVVSAVLFRVMGRLLRETDVRVSCAALTALIIFVSNVSLFTATLTYGAFLLTMLLWLLPRVGVELERPGGWRII